MLIEKIAKLSDELEKHYLEVRHDLHAHPELSYKEFRTSQKVQDELQRMGIPFVLSPVKPGVIATIDSGKPGKLLLLRADMDALPIQETTDLPYASQCDGVMHACGHDVHTTNLLAVCEILNRTKDQWKGRVRAVFQPAEENGGGGREMIKAGLMEEKPDACMGMHVGVWDPGVFSIGEGYVSAYSDAEYITVHGKAVHSSKPEKGVDAVVIAASIVVALNTICSRNISPMAQSTLNVGTIHGGTAVNVVTDKVEIGAMLRNADPESRENMFQKIEEISRGIAEGMGGSVDLRRHYGYRSVCDPFCHRDHPEEPGCPVSRYRGCTGGKYPHWEPDAAGSGRFRLLFPRSALLLHQGGDRGTVFEPYPHVPGGGEVHQTDDPDHGFAG